MQYAETFTIPMDAGIKHIELYDRVTGKGTAYFDEVSMYMIKDVPFLYFEPEEVFYYTDLEQGNVKAYVQEIRK